MTPVLDMPRDVVRFVELGLWGDSRSFGAATAIGFANETEGFVAGVVYHNYEPWGGTIEMSAYSSRRDWVNKERLRIIYDFPFDEVGVRACVSRQSEHNTRAIRIWRALGAEITRIPDLRGDGEAEVVALLKRDTWQNSRFKG